MKPFMPDAPAHIREERMKEESFNFQETIYDKPLSREEIEERQAAFSQNHIELARIAKEKAEVMKVFKDKTQPFEDQNSILIQEIKTKQSEVKGTIYNIPNYEEKLMVSYDQDGNFVSSRRLKPEERQTTVLQVASRAS